MLRNWFIPALAVLALTVMTPLNANAQLGKKGDKDEENSQSQGKSEKSDSSKKDEGRSQDSNKGRERDQQDRDRNDDKRKQDDDRNKAVKFDPSRGQSALRKQQPSRSGNVKYGTSSNLTPTVRGRSDFKIPEAPKVLNFDRGSRDAYREDRTRRHDDFRIGYVQYNNYWNDDWFYYPHYAFNYSPGRCVPSPFYYYSNVPGYVVSARIKIGNFSFQIWANDRYQWHRPTRRGRYDDWSYDDRRYNDVDYAIDDIVTAFERGRMGYMDDLMPRGGDVQVALEDYANYRMRSDDFYDMLADIVENTDTREYRVRDVRYERGQVVVHTEHEYRDAFGRRDRKYHTIVLDETRNGFEIEYFRVDRRRNW